MYNIKKGREKGRKGIAGIKTEGERGEGEGSERQQVGRRENFEALEQLLSP